VRVVLDTNTVVSALLFNGTAAKLVELWQAQRVQVLVSRAIVEEYLRVLAYPKFVLTEDEISGLLHEELLPFVEVVEAKRRVKVVRRDPDDDKFIECAITGGAEFVVTGDRELLALGSFEDVQVIPLREFLAVEASRSGSGGG